MSNSGMGCPACGTGMEKISEPDLTYEKCPQCGGTFLGAGELNALLTGMPGDIEHCSLGADTPYADKFSQRVCPHCPQQEMRKENLLHYSQVIFDYCENCHGWFLDRDELAQANEVLSEIRSGDAEYRGTHHGRLVTLVKVPAFVSGAVGPLGTVSSAMVTWNRVDTFFAKPLSGGLRVSPETWMGKLRKLLGAHDVITGHGEFDAAFHVSAEDPQRAASSLSQSACEAILRFSKSPPGKLGKQHRFEILDDRIVYLFLDTDEAHNLSETDKRQLFDALADTAAAIDGA